MTAPAQFSIDVMSSLTALDAGQWDACAYAEDKNPFLRHAFLASLEQSGSAIAKTGWTPAHIIVRDQHNIIRAACPSYIKSHSMGEYVFDHAWADAWQRAGGHYYPKIQLCVPFTPVTGPRLLIHPSVPRALGEAMLIKGLLHVREQVDASSIHVTFPSQKDWQRFGQADFLLRTGKQFHFINHDYADFDDFLSHLSSRKRKMIKRERAEALSAGIDIEQLSGADILPHHWDAFFSFYIDTSSRKWGQPYLTRAFFELIGASMSEDIVLIMAKREGRYIAGAINFRGADCLYGRNWGCIEQHPFLHFEVCYYQAIDYALRHRLKRVEAGAQGEHKLMRGYQPVETFSAHYIHHPAFARAVENALDQERQHIKAEIKLYSDHLPFKKTQGPSHEL